MLQSSKRLKVHFAAIIGGNYLEGGTLAALVNVPAAIIVIGGTLGAAMLQTPWQGLKLAASRLAWVFSPPSLAFNQGSGFSNKAYPFLHCIQHNWGTSIHSK